MNLTWRSCSGVDEWTLHIGELEIGYLCRRTDGSYGWDAMDGMIRWLGFEMRVY